MGIFREDRMKNFTWAGDLDTLLAAFSACGCGSKHKKKKSSRSGHYVCGACHLKEEVDAVKESK
jgi:hypothetical protein